MNAIKLLTILGATATGKTSLAVAIARWGGGEILSADSRQVFRGMDIGTGKDLAEYGPEYGQVPHHLIDIRDPGEPFSLFDFQQSCREGIQAIAHRGSRPMLVGGTGLYLESILGNYRLVPVAANPGLRQELAQVVLPELIERLRQLKPKLHNTTDLRDRESLLRAIEIAMAARDTSWQAPPLSLEHLVIGIRWERSTLRQRITTRLMERLEAGLVAEVSGLIDRGVSEEVLANYGLEYRYGVRHLRGELDRDEFIRELNHGIHGFAKRQESWFRRMERHGVTIHWVAGDDDPETAARKVIEPFWFGGTAISSSI